MVFSTPLASEFYSQLSLIGACQCITLAYVIYSIKQEARPANLFLSVFIALVSIRLLIWYFLLQGFFQEYPIIFSFLSLSIASGPLLYFYVRALSEEAFIFKPIHYVHFLPTLIILTLVLTVFKPNSYNDIVLWYQRADIHGYSGVNWIFPIISACLTMVYSVLAAICLYQHRQKILEHFANIENKTLQWLWIVIVLLLMTPISEFVLHNAKSLLNIDVGNRFTINLVFSALIMFIIAIKGLKQTAIFPPSDRRAGDKQLAATTTKKVIDEAITQQETIYDDKLPGQDAVNKKPDESIGSPVESQLEIQQRYKKSGLDADDIDRIWQKLLQYLQDEKTYLSCTLNLRSLAADIRVSYNALSQVINVCSQGNFFDFINAYRVEFAKALLEQETGQSLQDVAFASGFSSQSAFSTRFKKVTSQTPSQYVRLLANQEKR